MNTLFVDTVYWIALLHPGERFHRYAVAQWTLREDCLWVTSDLVLIEVLNFFAGRGATFRQVAVGLVECLQDRPNTHVVRLPDMNLALAVGLYDGRRDKGWSLTDCSSFVIMERMNIREALTLDKHFEQAGYGIIMKHEDT